MVGRVLAVVFGVVVIVAGLAVRADRTASNAESDRAATETGQDPYEVFDDSGVRMLCIEELRAVCSDSMELLGFSVRMEPVWATLDRLASGRPLGADVWLTVRPYDELAQAPGTAASLQAPTSVVARSPFVLVGPPAAIRALDSACPDPATRFVCAATGERARQLTLHDPRSSAFGPLALATVAHELGVPDGATGVDDPEVLERLRSTAAAGRRSQAPFEDAQRIAASTIAFTVEAEVAAVANDLGFEEQQRWAGAELRYPIDVRSAEVVAVPVAAFGRRNELEGVLRSTATAYGFEQAGFWVEGRTRRSLDFSPAFRDRPAVRTDLPFGGPLVQALRAAVLPR